MKTENYAGRTRETLARNQEIARTILEQLGRQFVALTGAFNFYALDSGLQFQLKGGTKDGINKVRIVLTSGDDYSLTFYKGAGIEVAHVSGIYNDNLQDVFEHHTGLFTTLFARRG